MSNYLIRNAFSHLQRRFLQSLAAHSPAPPLPTAATSSSSFTVQFLVNSCGLSLPTAVSVSKTFQLNEKTPQKPHSVLRFLKSHNFSDTLIAQLIAKRPRVLNCKVQSTLHPKFEYLLKNGFQGELLHRIILSNPDILNVSLDACIKPSFEFLRRFIHSEVNIVLAIKRASWLLTGKLKQAQPNVDFLIKEGMSAQNVGRLLTFQPRSMLHSHERIVYAVNFAKTLSFEPTAPSFPNALRVILQINESTWKKKIRLMEDLGFKEEETLKAFKRAPNILACSEENIRNSVAFYLNTVKLGPENLIACPVLFPFSIEKRIRPRYSVFKVLESKNLIKRTKNIVTCFKLTEMDFLKKYVDKHSNEVPGLMEIYCRAKEAKKIVS